MYTLLHLREFTFKFYILKILPLEGTLGLPPPFPLPMPHFIDEESEIQGEEAS